MKLEYKKYKNIDASYTFEGAKRLWTTINNKTNKTYFTVQTTGDGIILTYPISFLLFFNRNNLSGT